MPLLYQAATGNLGEEEIAGPLRQIFRSHPDVRFLRANVQQVDPPVRLITGGTLEQTLAISQKE